MAKIFLFFFITLMSSISVRAETVALVNKPHQADTIVYFTRDKYRAGCFVYVISDARLAERRVYSVREPYRAQKIVYRVKHSYEASPMGCL